MQVVFIGKELGGSAAAVVAAYQGRPVLTVTELPRGAEAGAMLNFIDIDNRIRFEASPAAAEQGGLKLSSKLLAVAERVMPAGQ